MRSIKEAEIKHGTRVFVASDLDVSIEFGKILDTFRLDCMLPTLKYIIEKGGYPVIGGHIGRPKGKVVAELSTELLRPFFDKHLGVGKYELLENLRFDPREEEGNEEYAQDLSGLADIYVNEVFSTSHRKDASIVGVPKYIPAFAGLRLEQEIKNLSELSSNAQKPFIVIIGGAKLEDKKVVVSRFVEIADYVLVGGKIGLQWEAELPQNLIIPTDYVGDGKDIGPETIKEYSRIISTAKTILWAGPMGMYENPNFMNGSKSIASAVVTATKNGAHSVVGGGDSVEVLTMLDLRDGVSFVSTGGGAMLDYLAYGTLAGIEALSPGSYGETE
jgi:phosphoglycerate kinase